VDTSVEAAEEIDASAPQLRARVRFHIYQAQLNGHTCDEIEELLSMRHQTASARIRELELMGSIIKTERKRPTRSGRNARVYIAKEFVLRDDHRPRY
jgi:predicted transcriptional regulator